MSEPDLNSQIVLLRQRRIEAATYARVLVERELDARLLRLKIEVQLRDGNTKTDAEKLAKVDDRYLAHERETARLSFELASVEAEAEATLWGLRLQITVLERVGV